MDIYKLKAAEMVCGLEYIMYEERLRDLKLKPKLRGNLAVYCSVQATYRAVHEERVRSGGHKLQ